MSWVLPLLVFFFSLLLSLSFSLDVSPFSLSLFFFILPFLICTSLLGTSLLQAIHSEAYCWVKEKNKEIGPEFYLSAFYIPGSWRTGSSGWAQACLQLFLGVWYTLENLILTVFMERRLILIFYASLSDSIILLFLVPFLTWQKEFCVLPKSYFIFFFLNT